MYCDEAFDLFDIPFIGPRRDDPAFDDEMHPDQLVYGTSTPEECVDPASDPVSLLDAFGHFTEDLIERLFDTKDGDEKAKQLEVPSVAKDADPLQGEHKTENGSIKAELDAKAGKAGIGYETKSEHETETGADHVKGGASAKVGLDGGEGSLELGGGSSKIDHAKEEERQKKENAEYLEFLKKKERGELPPGASFKPSDEAKATPAEGSASKVKSKAGWGEDGGHAGVGAERETTSADGSKSKTSGGVTYTPGGKDGPSVAVEAGVNRTGADGKKQLSGNASAEVNKNGLDAKVNLENDKYGGGLEITAKDGEDALKGKGKAGTDTVTISLNGGVVVKFGAPAKLPGNLWSVTYTITKDIGGSVGASDPKATGMKVGGSLSASAGSAFSATKVFPSEEAALAFRSKESVAEVSFPETPSQVAAMKPGEKFVMDSSSTIGGEVTASGNFGGGAAGRSTTDGERTSVEMNADHTVFAERTATVDETGKLSYTAPGGLAGISGSNTKTKTVRTRIKVDLGSEDNPNEAGRAAYSAFMERGHEIEPAQVVSRTTSDGKTTGREINLGPVKGFEMSEVTDSVTYDGEGNKTEETTGERKRGWGIKGFDVGGSYGTKLEAIQKNDDDAARAYIVTSTVEQHDAYDSVQRLDKITNGGIRTEGELQGKKGSGKWEVQSMLEPAAVDRFVAEVQNGNYTPQLVTDAEGKATGQVRTHNYFSAGDELKKALKEAGDDPDKQRKALAQFVADGGEDAVAQMRALGGAGDGGFVKLENEPGKVDPNFRGVEGRLEMETWIARLQTRAESGDSDPNMLLTEIKALSANVRTRINTITPEKYPDLPPGVMATEVGQSKKDLERLEALAGPLRAAVKDARLAKLTPEEREERAKQTEIGTELEGIAEGGDGKQIDPALKQAAKMKYMAAAKAAAEKERDAARATQKKHASPHGATKSRRPRDRISSWNATATTMYITADAEVTSGHSTFLSACAQETAALAMPETDDANIEAATSMLEVATRLFTSAKASFASAIYGYNTIATENPDDDMR